MDAASSTTDEVIRMQQATIAASIAAILLIAGVGIGVATSMDASPSQILALATGHDHDAGHNEAAMHGGMAGDHHGQLGMERPAFPPAQGSIPSADDATRLEEVHHLRIFDDSEFTPSNGVRSGNGTLDDPYIITGYYVTGDLYIADTDACFIVKENFIRGQLTLNWNGQCAHVHHNYISDLRVNENVKRTGYATGGLLELNKIGFLGQLRHYDGEFRHNEVGPYNPNNIFDTVLETVPVLFVQGARIANIDGFNQGLIHHNTFLGSVDLDLHGHHHGSGFFAPHSHVHAPGAMEHDHTERWTSVAFTDNKIVDPEGYGLRYEDRNHRGDDQTARSEDEDDLELAHTHHTHIDISRNTIEGGGLWIDVFNADDSRHDTRNPGTLILDGNTIAVQQPDRDLGPWFEYGYSGHAGIQIQTVKELELFVRNNTLQFTADADRNALEQFWDGLMYDEKPAGIRVVGVRDGSIEIRGNQAVGFDYGVWARQMDEETTWTVEDNSFDAQNDIWYDESVANEPNA